MIGEVDRVIPNVKPVAYLRPSDQVLVELVMPRIVTPAFVHRRAERASNRGKLDDQVVTGPGFFRRRLRIVVRQRLKSNLREILRELPGNGIYKLEDQAGRIVIFLHGGAGTTHAPIRLPALVDLRDGKEICPRAPEQRKPGVLDEFPTHLVVGQAN